MRREGVVYSSIRKALVQSNHTIRSSSYSYQDIWELDEFKSVKELLGEIARRETFGDGCPSRLSCGTREKRQRGKSDRRARRTNMAQVSRTWMEDTDETALDSLNCWCCPPSVHAVDMENDPMESPPPALWSDVFSTISFEPKVDKLDLEYDFCDV